MLAIFFASTGGFNDPDWKTLLIGLASSVLATVVTLYFLHDIRKDHSLTADDMRNVLAENMNQTNCSHFGRVDRNMDMGDEFWISMIDEIASTPEPVWFVGSSLSWWLKTRTYKEPLKRGLVKRLESIPVDNLSSHADHYPMTFVFLAKSDAVAVWKEFFGHIIDELTRHQDRNKKKELENYYWNTIMIREIPKVHSKYSLVLCGDRLAVTPYTSTGRSEDSPSLEIKKDSVVRKLFIDDLMYLKTKIEEQGKLAQKDN
jgi:hypothetical protein